MYSKVPVVPNFPAWLSKSVLSRVTKTQMSKRDHKKKERNPPSAHLFPLPFRPVALRSKAKNKLSELSEHSPSPRVGLTGGALRSVYE